MYRPGRRAGGIGELVSAALRQTAAALALAFMAGRADAASWTDKAPLVVTMRGSPTPANKPLARTVRRSLAEKLGPLRSSKAWRAAVRRAGLSPRDPLEVEQLAAGARAVGARYLLDMSVYRYQSQWVLEVRLIRAADARVLRRPRYPFKSMGPAALDWHVKQIVGVTLRTLAQYAARGG